MHESVDFTKLNVNHQRVFYNLHKLLLLELFTGVVALFVFIGLILFHTFEWLILMGLAVIAVVLTYHRKATLEECKTMTISLTGNSLVLRLYENWNMKPVRGWMIDLTEVESVEMDDKSIRLFGPYKVELFDQTKGEKIGDIDENREVGRVLPVTIPNCFKNWDELCDVINSATNKT